MNIHFSLPAILYDNNCELCKSSVRFITGHGGKNRFEFLPLQSPEGKKCLKENGYPEDYIGSVLLIDQGIVFSHSDAVFEIFRKLDRPWRWLYIFRIFPRPVRDFFYSTVSRLRHRVWVQRVMKCEHCGA